MAGGGAVEEVGVAPASIRIDPHMDGSEAKVAGMLGDPGTGGA